MLKAWKDTCQQSSHSTERVEYRDTQLRRICTGDPSLVTVNAASSSSVVPDSAVAHNSIGGQLKRVRDLDNDVENATKRRKRTPTSCSLLFPTKQEAYESIRQQNTVAVLDSFDDVIEFASRFLEWMVSQPTIPGDVWSTEKVSLLIVDQTASLEYIAQRLAVDAHLDIVPFSGSISSFGWSSLMEHDVVIFSVNALLERLTTGVIKMSQLSALVVLDAHMAMCTSSPFVNMIKSFYRSTSVNVRPRILALCTTVGLANAWKFEELLEAKIALDFAEENERFRPTEVVIQYEPAFSVLDTKLTEQIRLLDSSESILSATFVTARYVLKELGPCASDLTWLRAIKENGLTVEHHNDDPVGKVIADVHTLVKNWVFSMPDVNPSSRGLNVTSKFARLVQLLKVCKPYGDRFRGIILVDREDVATAMADMLRTLTDDLAYLRPLTVLGELPITDQQTQHDVYRGFSTGKHNLLIVARVLEDLDFPAATLVVRYDIFESQLSYAYACAYTARSLGCLVHMVETGNDVHRRILTYFADKMFDERWIEVVRTGGNVPLPSQPLREYFQAVDEQYASVGPYIEDPTSSGRLYERDAACALYRFLSNASRVSQISSKGLFTAWQGCGNSSEWVCNVLLPPGLLSAQQASIPGPPCSTLTHARRAAAFAACMQLYEHGVFDHRVFPHPLSMKLLKDTQRAAITNKASGSQCYPHKRTQFWLNSIRLFSGRWFPLVIHLQGLANYAPILLLTRQPLPRVAVLRLFLEGIPCVVQNTRCAPVEISADRLHALHLFTIRICRSILNKPFACSADNMAYLFAPVSSSSTSGSPSQILDHVPWDLVLRAGKEWAVPLCAEDLRSEQGIEDVVVQDRMVEFTRRYYALHLRRDLTPLSKPEDSPREAGYVNFVEYCKARRKGFEGLQDYQQPMIEVSRVASISNHLNPIFRPSTEPARAVAKYLIPELTAKFTIPASTFRTALVLPSIMKRIEDFLVVQELNTKFFNHAVHEDLLFAAISTPSAGYEVDYERLELFGDSFLKYLASIYVFVMNPAQHEGALHTTRQRIISNKTLMESADRTGLPQYIQGKPFSYKHWQPPNFTTSPLPGSNATEHGTVGDEKSVASGRVRIDDSAACINCESDVNSPSTRATKKSLDDSATQWLGDKTIADVVEAIIGAAYLCSGQESAFQIVKILQVPIHHIEQWDDFRRKASLPPPNHTAPLRAGTVEAVEAIVGHNFCHAHVLRSALIHASVEGYDATHYERLEFIGDAILDFMVVRYIFSRDEKLSPGAMTMLKGAMVSNSALAAICVLSGLYRHLHYDSYPLGSSFETYLKWLELRRVQETESATREGKSPGQYWLDIEPPKALSDLVESLIGALFISDGFQLAGAQVFFDRVLKPFYDKHITLKTLSHHPTKILFELLQKHGCQHFEMVKERCDSRQETRCDVTVHEIILASATTTTVNTASRAASLAALDALEGDPDFMNRTCACKSSTQGKGVRKVVIEEMLAQMEAEPTP